MEIKSTKDIEPTKINAIIFGESGVGKTTLASTLKEKTAVVSLEGGLMSLKRFDIDYVEVNTVPELKATIDELEKSDYKNIFIDSLTEVSQLFFDKAKLKYPDDGQSFKLYGYILEKMTGFIKYCRDTNKNVFFTALQKQSQDELGRRFYTPDMQGSISTKCPAYFDFVLNYQIIESKGEEKRVLITDKTDKAIAKDRSGLLDKYEKPDLQAIIDKVFK